MALKKPKFKNGTTLWNVLAMSGGSIQRIDVLNYYLQEMYGEVSYCYDIRIWTGDTRNAIMMSIEADDLDSERGFDCVDRDIMLGFDHAFTSQRRAERFLKRVKEHRNDSY